MTFFESDPLKKHNKMIEKQRNKKQQYQQDTSENEDNNSAIRYFQKRNLNDFSDDIMPIVRSLKEKQMYSNGTKWFTAFMSGAKNDATAIKVSFLNDLVDQNYAILHELDRHNQDQKTIIKQNEEIIELLKKIADQH